MQTEHEFYEGTINWFVYYLLELGPLKVYEDANKVLEKEIADRLEEGSWSDKELSRYIRETLSLESSVPIVPK